MRRYGTKKIATRVSGHQDCGICHPPQKSHKARARRFEDDYRERDEAVERGKLAAVRGIAMASEAQDLEIDRLTQLLARAYAEIRKQTFATHVVFDREICELADAAGEEPR